MYLGNLVVYEEEGEDEIIYVFYKEDYVKCLMENLVGM